MIKIRSLSFKYPQTSNHVFKDVNLDIEPGTLTLVTGATGSGKSTLLRCINGLVPYFSGGTIAGNIRVFGHDPIKEGPDVMANKVGFVFQEPEAQFVFDIVEDEIAFSLENTGLPHKEMQMRVNETLCHLNLDYLRKNKIHEISGGEKQKTAIASALVQQPEVLILDEPTSQLDPVAADELLSFITKLKQDMRLTVIISEHRLERLLPYTDAIAHLTDEDRLIFGTPQEILQKMDQVPPIIQIAKKLKIAPLPLTVNDFPKIEIPLKDGPEIIETQLGDETAPLEVINLSAKLDEQKVLDQIHLQLFKGEIVTLIGPTGAGKTTLLRSILGLNSASGQRLLHKKDMDKMKLSEVIHHIAYLPQNPNDLLFAESVEKELQVTLQNHKLPVKETEITASLNLFKLIHLKNRYPRDLSVGERQRTALAAITIHKPGIIFLDEPTRGLDYNAKHTLSEIIKMWRDDKRSILLVTHDIEFAARVADRVIIIEKGKIIFKGSPRKAFSEFSAYRTQTARLFPEFGWITPEDVFAKRK
jgi:energy-coupling factor transport system ATP-binding protein